METLSAVAVGALLGYLGRLAQKNLEIQLQREEIMNQNLQIADQNRKLMDMARRMRQVEEHERVDPNYPCPSFLKPYKKGGVVNFCVVGAPGSGKTSFINLCRGLRPNDPRCGYVGHNTEGTLDPERYIFDSTETVNIFDMPGYGTPKNPAKSYFKNTGVKHFDFVLIFTVERYREMDRDLLCEMQRNNVPFIFVRNKVDQTIRVMIEDEGILEENAIETLRANVMKNIPDGTDVFVVSSRWTERRKYDMPRLMMLINEKIEDVKRKGAQNMW